MKKNISKKVTYKDKWKWTSVDTTDATYLGHPDCNVRRDNFEISSNILCIKELRIYAHDQLFQRTSHQSLRQEHQFPVCTNSLQ